MPSTYTLISSNVLTSSAASVTFSSIPSTYTDLVLRVSARDDQAAAAVNTFLELNSTSGIYSRTRILGNGATASSARATAETSSNIGSNDAASATANTFASFEIYIPNYAGTTQKAISSFSAQEDNSTTAYINAAAILANLTSAITQVKVIANSNFVSGSSFYLYGIKNS